MSKRRRQKIVNFRAFVSIVLYIVAIVLCTYIIFASPLVGITLMLLAIGLKAVFVIVNKTHTVQRFAVHVIGFVLGLVVLLGMIARIAIWEGGKPNGAYYFVGRVDSYTVEDDYESINIILASISIDNQHTSGKLRVVLRLSEDSARVVLDDGYIVRGYGNLNKVSALYDGRLNIATINRGVRYTSTLSSDNITIVPQALRGMALLRKSIQQVFDSNLSVQNAAIAKAMVLGDKSALTAETNSVFVFSGFAHILAVSGLHLSIFGAVLGFILKKLKINRLLSLLITIVVLFGFAYIAGFSASVLRAFFMASILGLSKYWGAWYDGLNSLSIAAIALILINPFFVFNTSFLLSFGATLSIILFYKSTKAWTKQLDNRLVIWRNYRKIYKQNKLYSSDNPTLASVTVPTIDMSTVYVAETPSVDYEAEYRRTKHKYGNTASDKIIAKKMAIAILQKTDKKSKASLWINIKSKILDAIALLLAVQIVSIPITMYLLGQIATYSILTNLLLMPFITILFGAILLAAPIILIIPFVSFVMIPINIALNAFTAVLAFVSGLPFAIIYVSPLAVAVATLIIVLVVASRFWLSKYYQRAAIIFTPIMYLIVIVSGINFLGLQTAIVPLNSGNTYIATTNSTIGFVSTTSNASYVINDMHSMRLYKMDYMLITSNIYGNVSDYVYYKRALGLRQIILPYTIDTDFAINLAHATGIVYILEHNQNLLIDDFDVSILGDQESDGEFYGYSLLANDINIVTMASGVYANILDDETLSQFDIIRGRYSINSTVLQIVDYNYDDEYDELIIVAQGNKGIYLDYSDYSINRLVVS